MQTLKATWHVRRLALTVVVLAGGVAPFMARAASPTNPMVELLSKPGNDDLCFRRVYDKAHLQRHPGQLTTLMLLSLAPSKDNAGRSVWLKLQLHQMGRASPANIGASCGWSATANRDTSGNRLIRSYPRQDGFVCLAMYNNNAAEEAGTLMLDLARDGRTVTVHLDAERIGLWGTLPDDAIPDAKTGEPKIIPGHPGLKPGPEDRVFRLTRADPSECRAMEQAIDLQY